MPKLIKYQTEGIPHQQTFHDDDDHSKVYMSTGFGGGKTYALIMKMFKLMTINRGCPGGILAPSYKMYKRDVMPTIKDICRENRIRYKYNRSDMLWYFPDAQAYVYAFTAEDEDSIKGPNLAWFVINEVTLCSERSVMMALARIRLKKAKLLQAAMSGTPEGFNWCYDYFIKKPRKDTRLIFGDARLNKHVAESYFANLAESYDPLMQKQYIQGLYVNLNAKAAAWSFNRHRHTAPSIPKIPGLPVWVSLDFNVHPMAATLFNRVPLGFHTGDPYAHVLLRGFGEIKIDGSNTYEMADAIMDRLEKGKDGRSIDTCYIYPDPAGRARSTKTRNYSDFDILVEKGFPRSHLKYRSVISVKDCLNSLNSLLSKNLMVLDRENCTEAISDMEQCVLKGNVFEIDKSNPKRTHWLDGVKNMVDYEFPIRRGEAFRQERFR